jgi:hypothetical protein
MDGGVERMNGPHQSHNKLAWKVFLSQEEILRWVDNREKPNKPQLSGQISHPGVYRFLFPEQTDGASSHKPCYVGETGDLGNRMPDYLCAIKDKEKRDEDDKLILNSEWMVQGAIQNAIRDSIGRCSLQLLTIEGSVTLCEVTLNDTDLDNVFARRFLENWAILKSIGEGFYPLNCGLHQSTKDFWRMAKSATEKALRRGMDIESGWPESL